MMNIKQNLKLLVMFILNKVWNYLTSNSEIYKSVFGGISYVRFGRRGILNYLSVRIYYNIMYLQVVALL